MVSLSNHALGGILLISAVFTLPRKAWFDRLTTNGIFDWLITKGIFDWLGTNGISDKLITNGVHGLRQNECRQVIRHRGASA